MTQCKSLISLKFLHGGLDFHHSWIHQGTSKTWVPFMEGYGNVRTWLLGHHHLENI